MEAISRYVIAGAKGKPRQLSVMIADEPAQIIRYLSNTNLDSPWRTKSELKKVFT